MTNTDVVYRPKANGQLEVVQPTKAGRKTNLERSSIALENERLERKMAQERKRAPRLQPDTKGSLIALLIIAFFSVIPAFVISYATTVAVAVWIKLPFPALNYIVPGVLELLIIFSSYDFLVSESRNKGSGRTPFWIMIAFSIIAVLANASHTVAAWGAHFGGSNWQSLVGVTLAAAAPFVVVYLSKRLARLAFAEGEE